jgi:hypothetical protein
MYYLIYYSIIICVVISFLIRILLFITNQEYKNITFIDIQMYNKKQAIPELTQMV